MTVPSVPPGLVQAIADGRCVAFLGAGMSQPDAPDWLGLLRQLAVHDGAKASDEPIGYAIMPDRPQAWCDFMRRHDGIEILRYETKTDPGHSGFDTWLERIHAETASGPRVARLLQASAAREGTNAQIVWIDRNPTNNAGPQVDELRRGGVDIVQLADPGNLSKNEHRRAALMITSFDRSTTPSLFDDVMTRMNGWSTRPPVVVFTSPSTAGEKRGHCLRRGAVDICSTWGPLFDIIERLFRE